MIWNHTTTKNLPF